jgi:hypothetical protein
MEYPPSRNFLNQARGPTQWPGLFPALTNPDIVRIEIGQKFSAWLEKTEKVSETGLLVIDEMEDMHTGNQIELTGDGQRFRIGLHKKQVEGYATAIDKPPLQIDGHNANVVALRDGLTHRDTRTASDVEPTAARGQQV